MVESGSISIYNHNFTKEFLQYLLEILDIKEFKKEENLFTESDVSKFFLFNPMYINYDQFKYYATSLLPLRTGIEIECDSGENFDSRYFSKIPHILVARCTKDEKRFRIPIGLHGMQCLYYICANLRNSCIKTDSGIHFHINMGKYIDLITQDVINDNKDWILSELDSWAYKGSYNARNVSFSRDWVRVCKSKKSIEFRICDMSFDYTYIICRILHCQNIIKKLLVKILNNNTNSTIFDLDYIKKILQERESNIYLI